MNKLNNKITRFITLLISFLWISNIQAAIPENDDLANAIAVTSFPFTDTVTAIDSDDAFFEAGEILCASGFYTGTWWYSITTATGGTITADAMTLGATVPANNSVAVNIAIYSGATHPLTELACDASFRVIADPLDDEINPTVNAVVGPGTYFIAVGNSISNTTANSITTTLNFEAVATPPESIPVNNIYALMMMILGLIGITRLNKRNRNVT